MGKCLSSRSPNVAQGFFSPFFSFSYLGLTMPGHLVLFNPRQKGQARSINSLHYLYLQPPVVQFIFFSPVTFPPCSRFGSLNQTVSSAFPNPLPPISFLGPRQKSSISQKTVHKQGGNSYSGQKVKKQ